MHLLAAISPHGFGHLAQTAAVLNALRASRPDLRLTLRTTLPEAVLKARITGPFALQPRADDFGMVQHDALEVDLEASARCYAEWHAGWAGRVDEVARELEAAAPDLILADIPYLTLAGAARAGIPAVAMCCLNWADIYRHFCGGRREAGKVLEQMEAAYNSAALFLRTEPAMPMPFLENARDIGPVVNAGRNRRAELAERLCLAPGEALVLVATGGIRMRLPVEDWPRTAGRRYLVQADWRVAHPDAVAWERSGIPFADVLASSDLLLTKPGYGSFTEAAASGVPVLYLPRPRWPESPYLERWINARGRARSTSLESLAAVLAAEADTLLPGRHEPVAATGVEEAVAELVRLGG